MHHSEHGDSGGGGGGGGQHTLEQVETQRNEIQVRELVDLSVGKPSVFEAEAPGSVNHELDRSTRSPVTSSSPTLLAPPNVRSMTQSKHFIPSLGYDCAFFPATTAQ